MDRERPGATDPTLVAEAPTVPSGGDLEPTLDASVDGATPAPAALPRTIGRYQVRRVLGRGGMGTVFAAHDPELGRDVAVKTLRHVGDVGLAMAERLRREAQALARVVHPNVVGVYDAGVAGATPFLVMQLIAGATLEDHLRRHRPSTVEVVALYAQAGRGLTAIHDAGLIHRDVKPSNLLVDREGTVRVTDLGLARIGALAPVEPDGRGASGDAPATSTLTRGVAGTPAYMAPEQFEGGEITPACDQFSFCVSLWEALFAQRPFPGETADGIQRAVRSAEIREPPRGHDVPAAVVQALRRGLAYAPQDRFPSMRDLLAALQPPRRGRRWIGLAAALALVAGTAAVVLVARREPAHALVAPDAARPAAVSRIDAATAERITFADACEEFPSFAPDGATVYYDAQVGRDYHLFAAEVATWTSRELTARAGWDFAPVPSPDGRRLAFLRTGEESMTTYVAELGDLAHARPIARGGFRPAWSPDGSHVWVGGRRGLARYDVATGAADRTVAPPDQRRPLLGIELPDRRLVVLFTAPDGGIATLLQVYGADGAAPATLIDGPQMEEVLALAPERDAVVIASIAANGGTQLLRVPLDGAATTPIGGEGVVARKQLAISPRGDRAVWSDCRERTSLASLSGDGTLVQLLRGEWADAYPAAIPGTTRLLFLSDRAEGTRIWEVDRARLGPARRVPFGDIQPVRIAVSPDRRLIAASEGERGLFVAPLDGSAPPRQLCETPGELLPSFTHDGARIVFQGADGDTPRVAAVSVEGGAPTWVAPAGSQYPEASPVDDRVAYLTRKGNGLVPIVIDLRTGRARGIPGVAPYPWTELHWSTDGTRLLLVRNDGDVVEVEVATGRALRRITLGADQLAGATYLGDEIVVGRTQWLGDLWTASLTKR